MRTLLKILAGLLIVIAVLAGLLRFKPDVFFALVYPPVEAYALSDDFVGITTNGEVQEGLFSIATTGVSTWPVVDAAQRFIDTLDDEQRERALFPVDARAQKTRQV